LPSLSNGILLKVTGFNWYNFDYSDTELVKRMLSMPLSIRLMIGAAHQKAFLANKRNVGEYKDMIVTKALKRVFAAAELKNLSEFPNAKKYFRYLLDYPHIIKNFTSSFYKSLEDVKFSTPPIPETDSIRAISNARELLEEGEGMRHCIYSHAKDILIGDAYVYRVMHPERATLMIKHAIRPRYRWMVGELRGKDNSEVGNETQSMIDGWISTFNCKLKKEDFPKTTLEQDFAFRSSANSRTRCLDF